MKLATNKNIVLLPITQIIFNSSSLAPYCNDATLARHCSGVVMAGPGGQCWQACESLQLIFVAALHCCRQMNPMLPDRDKFPVTSNIWPFLRLAGILNQALDIFILISKLAALAQMVACQPLVQQVRGSIPGGTVNFHLKIFNLEARRGGDVHFLITRLYITGLD